MSTTKNIQKNKRQEGSALIIVMCVLCVLVALALSMIFAAYQVYSHVQKAAVQEQCKQSVITFDQQLEKEITKTGDVDPDSIRNYIKEVVLKGIAYQENEDGSDNKNSPNVVRSVNISTDTDSSMGTMSLTLYYAYEDEDLKKGYILYETLSCTYRGASYKETKAYTTADDGTTWTYESIPGGGSGDEE